MTDRDPADSHDDFDPDDLEPDQDEVYDHERDEDLFLVPLDTEPPLSDRQRNLLSILFLATVGLFAHQVLGGHLDYSSSWGVLGGIAVVLGTVFLPTWTVGVVVMLATAMLADYVLPAPFGDGVLAGLLTAAAAASAFLLVCRAVVVAPALLARIHLWGALGFRGRDRQVSADVSAGLSELEDYLAGAAPLMEPLTRRRMGHGLGQRIIGLSGYAGAGKDTAAAGLIFSRDYTRVSFADKLREFAYTLNPIVELDPTEGADPSDYLVVRLADLVDEVGWDEAKRHSDVRALLQRLGTDCGRQIIGENVWVDAVMGDLPDGPVVFTDVRFPNEAQAVKDAGGYVVRIDRPGVEAINAHPSETALDDWPWDAAVVNEGEPADARRQLIDVEDLLFGPAPTPAVEGDDA